MSGSAPTSGGGGRRDPGSRRTAIERERRERARRERDRRRTSGELTSPSPRRAASSRPTRAPAPAPTAAATRERHEGLVGWIARTVMVVPLAIVGAVRGVAGEVVSILAGIGRALRIPVPGGDRLSRASRTLVERTRGATATSDAALGAPARGRRPVLPGLGRSRPAAAAPRTEAERRAHDRQRQLLRRRLRIGAVVLALVAVVVGWVVVPASDLFRIRHVEVTGANAVGDLEVRQRVDALLSGETVFTVDEDAVAASIEELPFVRSAQVQRHLPGGLELRIVEYRPLALGTADGKRFWLVARDGRLLATADREEWETRVPVVQLVGDDLEVGERIPDEPGLQLLASRADESLLAFTAVTVTDGRIVGTLDDGLEVRFGRADALRAKVLVAERVLAEARRKELALVYVDVTVAGRAAICVESRPACSQARGPDSVGREAEASVDDQAITPGELDDTPAPTP